MDTEPFTPNIMQVYTVDSFNMPPGPLKAYNEAGREIPITREIDTICHAMQDVGHEVMECRILLVGDEWFVSAMLNVNLWTPYQFYYFNQESGKLMLLYEFDGRDVTAIQILSAEKLHALDQRSIGGWYEPFTPARLMEEHPEVIENAALMFLRQLHEPFHHRFHTDPIIDVSNQITDTVDDHEVRTALCDGRLQQRQSLLPIDATAVENIIHPVLDAM